MKKLYGLALMGLFAAAGSAGAHASSGDRDRDHDDRDHDRYTVHAVAQSAPEMSAGTMMAALTLLGGGLVVLFARRSSQFADRG